MRIDMSLKIKGIVKSRTKTNRARFAVLRRPECSDSIRVPKFSDSIVTPMDRSGELNCHNFTLTIVFLMYGRHALPATAVSREGIYH